MEIKIEMTPEIWQKYKNLALAKGDNAYFEQLINETWDALPAEDPLRIRRAEDTPATVAAREAKSKIVPEE